MNPPAQTEAPEPNAQPAGERAERIVEWAGLLFGRSGFHAVSLDHIGARVGITGPAVYRYFNSKQSLLALIFDRILNELMTRANVALSGSEDPAEALEALVDVHLDYALQNPHLVRLYVNEQRALTETDQRRIQQLQRTWQAIWISQLRAYRENLSIDAADAIVFASQWAICSVGYQRSQLERDERRHHVRNVVLRGLVGTADGDEPGEQRRQ